MGWLEAELAEAPGNDMYADVYLDAVGAVRQWRRRYRGDQALWRRLMRPERLVKEIVESAPVISAVCDYVESADGPVTVVDLCCGKGYLSMLLAEMLPPEKLRGCVLVDKAWPRHDTPSVGKAHINPEHIWQYRDEWPVPLATSKVDLKKRCSLRGFGERWLGSGSSGRSGRGDDGADTGPVLLLGVHLCGSEPRQSATSSPAIGLRTACCSPDGAPLPRDVIRSPLSARHRPLQREHWRGTARAEAVLSAADGARTAQGDL